MAASKVKVRGQAVVPATPDEVQISVEVSVLEKSPEAALAEVGRRSAQLDAVFEELAIPPAGRSTSGVSVQEERAWEKDREVHRGYRSTNRVLVRLADASVVGRLMSEATSRAQARINGPWWRVAMDNPARAEACRQAATEARRKAEAYAEALGARLGAVYRVTEPTISVGPGPFPQPRAMLAAAAEAAPDVTVQSGELDVSATVDVTFLLEQG